MSERVSDEQRQPAGPGFARLVEIMARLRAPGGCPWDREQNFDTIKPFLLEETYEVMDAIDARDWEGLADELGESDIRGCDLALDRLFNGSLQAGAVREGFEAFDRDRFQVHGNLIARAADRPAGRRWRWQPEWCRYI